MKIKEIIRTNKGGCIEDERENDKKVTTTVVISSLNYDDQADNRDLKPGSDKKTGKNSTSAVNKNDDDIVYHLNKKNNQHNVAFNDDYRYFGRTSMIDNAGFLLSDKHYCNCGSNNYATKKTLMLNDFWEWSNVKFKTANVPRYLVNEPATTITTTTTTTFVNRFVSEVANAGKCRLNSNTTTSIASAAVALESNRGDVNIDNNSCSLSPSSVCDKGQSQSLCLSSSVLLTDKRLVGLFRSVALYWFFCLNTVLAKGDHVFKRKAAVSPLNSGIGEQLLLQHNTSACSDSLASLQNNLQLQICCPDVVSVMAGVGQLNNDDFLWDLEAALAAAESDAGSNLLTWAEHSKARLFDDLFEKVLRDLANNCGIFKAIKPVCAKTVSSKRRMAEKPVEARKQQFAVGGAEPNVNLVGAAEQRRRFIPTLAASSKKTNRSGKKMIGVRRKYIIDVLDYYYDDDDDDEDDNDTVGGGGGRRASRKATAVVNRVIWKKRAVKNKLKSKRKMANAGVQQQHRVQQIIIECYGNADSGYVINDGYEEVVGASQKTATPTLSPVAPVCAAVAIDDELFIDFDSYAESLKREVAMRQQRKRKRPPAPSVVKIIEPSSSLKHVAAMTVESNITEDELSGGTGSTSSSLILELEEESSSYFLPDGRYHSATQKYPKYDLWCSPLVVEKGWPAVEPVQLAPSSGYHTTNGAGRISKPVKSAAPPAAPAFKPYRLWESSWAPEDDFIPSFVAARRLRRSPKYASMVTMSGPAATKTTPIARRRPTFGKEPACAAVQQSMYTLWGSPNIIDFLPGIGVGGGGSSVGGSNSSIHLNDGSGSSAGGTTSSSPEEASSMEYEEYAPAPDTFRILKSTAAAANEPRRDAFANHQQHPFNVRGGKFLNLKPIINGFVSFTDRGAFQYYKKPAVMAAAVTATTPAVISLALRSNRQSADSDEKASEVSAAAVSDASTATDASDVEVNNIAMTTSPKSDYDTPFHFKPIQPAFKVPTDTPASFERSESGTLWCNKQKLMTFKHELEEASVPQQRPRSRDSVHELDSFQPKFVVNRNDVGCQTEWFGLNGFENTAVPMLGSQTTSFFSPINEKKNSPDPSYVSGAAFLYGWDEVFNFLNKPAIGNIDVKAHLDFSCFF